MTERIPDAGELNQKVRLLSIREVSPCEHCEQKDLCAQAPVDGDCPCRDGDTPVTWTWKEYRKAWAKVTQTERMAIYANSGVGSREAELVLRRQSFTLVDAILWKEQFCLPTSITPLGPGHLLVRAALVPLRTCKGVDRETGRGLEFPAVVTERYQGHQQLEPMAQNAVRLVLVTPKCIKLQLGSLVTVGEDPDPWWVKIVHEVDEYKHEAEIERTVEP